MDIESDFKKKQHQTFHNDGPAGTNSRKNSSKTNTCRSIQIIQLCFSKEEVARLGEQKLDQVGRDTRFKFMQIGERPTPAYILR